jgi:hypothetical protein
MVFKTYILGVAAYTSRVVQEVLAGWENYTDDKVKEGTYPKTNFE